MSVARRILLALLLASSPALAGAQTANGAGSDYQSPLLTLSGSCSTPGSCTAGQFADFQAAGTIITSVFIISASSCTLNFGVGPNGQNISAFKMIPITGAASTSSASAAGVWTNPTGQFAHFYVWTSGCSGSVLFYVRLSSTAPESLAAANNGSVAINSPLDGSGYLQVDCITGCGGGGGAGAPLPGGTSTATAANQAVGIQGYDGSANMVPLQETGGSLNVKVTSGASTIPLTGGSTSVATAANQGVAIHAFNGSTIDAVRSFTFSGIPGWIASASTMYDPVTALNASVTAGGTNGTNAIAVQGITNGIALTVAQSAGTNLHVNIDNSPSVTLSNGTAQNSSGTGQFIPSCDQSAPISISSAADLQLVALTAGKQVHVCAYNFLANGAVAVTLEYGTGTNCATGKTSITGAYPLTGQTGLSAGSGNGQLFAAPVGAAVCINSNAAQTVSGLITYGVW